MTVHRNNFTRAAALCAAAALLLGGLAARAGAQSDQAKQQIEKLQIRLRAVDRQLAGIRDQVTADPEIARASKALDKAREAAAKAQQAVAEARKALANVTKQQEQKHRRRLEADKEANRLLDKYKQLASQADKAKGKVQERREQLESDKDVAAAKEAWDTARRKEKQAREAYRKVSRAKASADPRIKKLQDARQAKQAESRGVKRRLDRIERPLRRGGGALAAQRAYDRAVEAEKKVRKAKFAPPGGDKSAKTIEALAPERKAVDRRLGAIRRKIDSRPEVAKARKQSGAARTAAGKAEKAYRKTYDAKIAANKERAKLLAQLKKAKEGKARAAINKKLRSLRRKVREDKDVVEARKARDTARKAGLAKRQAYDKLRRDALADDPKAGDLAKRSKALQAKLNPAYRKLSAIRAKAEKDPAVVEARKKVVARKAAMNGLRSDYYDGIRARIAKYPEGKKLLDQRQQLLDEIRQLRKVGIRASR